ESYVAEQKPEEISFKVIDRRPFTAEGDLREGALEAERREQEAADKTAAAKEAAKEAAKPKAAAPSPSGIVGATGGAAAAPAPAAEEVPEASRHFQMLIDFLARNAAAMLGGMADPRTGQAFLDLEGAREMIDMLDVLREKTRGNLAPDDDSLLLEVIGSLKLSFMEMSKAAAAQAKKAPGKP
ncbi:MAG: DUF1844 domain-containing protein, partial [Candidatus Acidiferrales bacterium]